MPELPEIETIKRYLEKDLIGRKIKDVKIINKKSFIGDKKKILNSKILKIERKGKMLVFRLNNSLNLVFHLKLTGQLLFYYTNGNESLNEWQRIKNISHTNGNEFLNAPNQSKHGSGRPEPKFFLVQGEWQPIRYTRVIFILDKGFLIFNDARKFGWVKVLDDEDLNKELSKMGKEPFDLNFKYLKEIFSKTKRPIKIVLMDQGKIAGLGNIYANEALFLAKIHPLKPANKLKDNEIKDLLSAIKEVIKKAIELQGTSFRFYVKPDESKGSYQEEFLVYQRKNEKCLRCQSKIKYIKISGRGTFYCSRCQKLKI
jgi:formamidopyrimidine-DNA glycosylase